MMHIGQNILDKEIPIISKLVKTFYSALALAFQTNSYILYSLFINVKVMGEIMHELLCNNLWWYLYIKGWVENTI